MATKQKAKSKKEIKLERRRKRFYGMVKIRKGQKICWMSMQNKNGYSLGLVLGERTIWLRNVRFASVEEVSRAIEDPSVIFVHKKGEAV